MATRPGKYELYDEVARWFEVGAAPSEALTLLAEGIWAVIEERRAAEERCAAP